MRFPFCRLLLTCTWLMIFALSVWSCGDGDPVVVFADSFVDAAVRGSIGKPEGPIRQSDLQDLTRLRLWIPAPVDLQGLQSCTSLVSLTIVQEGPGRTTVDSTPISGLRNLVYLELKYVQVSDLGFLSQLGSLRELRIEDCVTGDLTPLANLAGLEYLELHHNGVSEVDVDLAPLSTLGSLATLYLTGYTLDDLAPLSSLTGLEQLYLRHCGVSDVSAISGNGNLTVLNLRGNRVSDLSPLTQLTALQTLTLDYNDIQDISPLLGNTGLQEGDTVTITYNPLSAESVERDIPELWERGVTVRYVPVETSTVSGE